MDVHLQFEISPQPDDATCGPSCLQAVYRYHGDDIALSQVIAEIPQLEKGGTFAVLLGCHALRRGYRAIIYTYNLNMFDPTWFNAGAPDLRERLRAQMACKSSPQLQIGSEAYLEFLDRGGRVRFEDLTPGLVRRYLKRGTPILTGMSATYLYRCAREIEHPGGEVDYDDVRGESMGHFVVLCGYDQQNRTVLVADPLWPDPVAPGHIYAVSIDRVICSILLGILTHDANLLIIERSDRSR